MNIVRLADAVPQPWRNGGGRTRELLGWPQGQDWKLRLSVADVTADGPFSAFPGVERWFVVLQGDGVELQFEGVARRVIRGDAPIAFDGAQAPGCHLIGGATLDLNLMVRQDAGPAVLQAAPSDDAFGHGAPWRALFSTGPGTLHAGAQGALALPAWALCWSDRATGGPWRWQPDDASTGAWWVGFHPIGPPAP